jgi:hypothetical protein
MLEMLDVIVTLAQSADATDGMPQWGKYALGPLGALVIMGAYAFYTEKKRIPGVVDQIKEAQKALENIRDEHKKETEALRAKFETEEKTLEKEIQLWRDKHTKERSARVWWQSKAEGFAKQLGEDSGIPPDIDKTHYRDES